MGCLHSAQTKPPAPDAAPPPVALPVFMTADPDLGWRNVSSGRQYYPVTGFTVDFQNERSGNVLKKLDLVSLAINIAVRASRLAHRYGVTDSGGFQSSSNLLEEIAMLQQTPDLGEGGWKIDIDKDMQKVLKHFGCPDFGWLLLSRLCETAPYLKSSPEVFLLGDHPQTDESLAHGASGDQNIMQELASVPSYLQKLKGAEDKVFILDVSEIGINIAEQLFRLEKSEAVGHRIPDDCFGWKVMASDPPPGGGRESFALPVSTPESEALFLVPEELIMHVASWVQRTYLTAPAF